MRSIFKLIGVIAIFLSFSLLGVLKAYSKRSYISRLKKIRAALICADDMLCGGAANREKILKQAFLGVEGFYISGSAAGIADRAIKGDIREVLDLFFNDFGSGDLEQERRRIERVGGRLLREIENEEKGYAAYAKIWQTAGVCAGLGVSIMLI